MNTPAFLFSAFAATMLAVAASEGRSDVNRPTEFGNSILSYPEAVDLSLNLSSSSLLPEPTPGARRVGGVVFFQAVQPDFVTVALQYQPDRPDGSRLLVLARQDGKVTPARFPAYDWVIKPVVEYVSSDTNAVVSLFGRLKEERNDLSANTYIVNYHPAFRNTLAGLRLFQLDTLAFSEDASYLPGNDANVLGKGETRYDQSQNRSLGSQMTKAMLSIFEQKNWFPSSYIVGDRGNKLTASIEGKMVAVHGELSWSFIGSQGPDNPGVISKGPSTSEGQYNFDISREISSAMVSFRGGNRTVYDSALNLMHLAAFLRHVKERNRKIFDTFAESVRAAPLDNPISTPTLYIYQGAGTPGLPPF